jgi:2-polyprenyl-6-methoxyphenol hydroxylase-like FAD-dependent oxidoreductase
MYDVIVIGARVGGSATAMLLAREGLRVLAVDRAAFPSDTLSTHQVQLPGVARLARWGLLDGVIDSGAPPTRRVRFDMGDLVLDGCWPAHEGVDALYSPRRTVLDALLVDAARRAGAEVRERFAVEEIVIEGGVVRVHGREKGGPAVTETARFVVGADGKHSAVARAARAAEYRTEAARSLACYTYWEGVEMDGGEMYALGRRAVGAWPTNDGLVMTYVAWPGEEFETFRGDVEGNVLATLDVAGTLGERVRSGRRAERFRATPDLPNIIRVPYGDRWALVGDAGLVMDPITGQGIGHALRDAELLARALGDAFAGRRPFDAALADYQTQRDRETLPMFDFSVQLASFAPPKPEEQMLFSTLARRPEEAQRFFGVLAGVVPMGEYFAPRNLLRVVGARGMARMMLGRMRGSGHGTAAQPAPAPAG